MYKRIFAAVILIICCILLNYSCKSRISGNTDDMAVINKGQSEKLFDAGWRFYRGDITGAEMGNFDDSGWRILDLPHDWSIEDLPGTNSPFNPDAISQVSGGFTTGGTGWYRKSFKVPGEISSKQIVIQFDGVYMNPEVWINGESLGSHPCGYTSFWFDLTDKVNFGKTNVLAVKVRNEGINSRWYSGSGIYRHVWLKVLDPVHVAQWGTSISTPEVNEDSSIVHIRTKVNNQSARELKVKVITRLLNSKGVEINSIGSEQMIGKEGLFEFVQDLHVMRPDIWSTITPSLYTAISEVYSDNKLVDRAQTKFGIRTIHFDVVNGFQLNGVPMKLKGGCFHHDNGPLGSKSYDRAEERRIELLKSSGFNAIRCSHNPPSPALLDACDRLGIMVIDEAFDMWNKQKNPGDYHLYFNEWWQRDIESMVLRDRNHPSVIMWSIGNEIPDRQKPEVVAIAKMLGDYIRLMDPARPVTSAVNDLKPDKDPYFATLDVGGYNYASGGDHNQKSLYNSDHMRVPERIMAGTESYPLEAFGAWMDVIDNPYVIGDFVWTAFDYIGEASIGWRGYPQEKNFFPWNLAYCGDLDICGWKRPQSYYRDALWKDNQLSIFIKAPQPSFEPNPKRESWSKWHWFDVVENWNWKGFENRPMEVNVYSSCEEAELFLNDKSLGKKKTNRSTEFKAVWDVPYQPGVLKATGYHGGKPINTAILQTAGDPVRIRLTADRNEITADGQDLSYITVELLDDKGIRNPAAENLVKFDIEGDGKIAGVGNANPISTESCQANERKAWQGRCLVIIKSGYEGSKIVVKALSGNLEQASVIVNSKNISSGTK
jgi:beta-galactosidase